MTTKMGDKTGLHAQNPKFPVAGFTLIEILLAVTIFSMVIAVMFSSFRIGIGSWEKGERDIELYQKIRAAAEVLHREISATYPYWVSPGELDTHSKFFVFLGSGESLRFVSYANLHRRSSGLSLVEIWVDESRGLMLGEAPVIATSLSDIKAVPLRDEEHRIVLCPEVQHIAFRYFDGKDGEDEGEWLEQWDPKDKFIRLPGFVEITITLTGERNEELKQQLIVPIMSAVVVS